MRRSMLLAATAAMGMAFSACNFHEEKSPAPQNAPHGSGDGEGVRAFAALQQELFEPFCVKCHAAGGGAGGVDLSSYAGVKAWVSPGNARTSTVYTEVQSGMMPPRGDKPSAELVAKLAAWIDAGADEAAIVPGTAPTEGPTTPVEEKPGEVAPPRPTRPGPAQPPPAQPPVDQPPPAEPQPEQPQPEQPGEPQPALETFATVTTKLFALRCNNCHGGERPRAGVDLTSYDKIMEMGADLMVPGNPGDSALMQVVDDGSMPPRGEALSAEQVAALRNWIARGAPRE